MYILGSITLIARRKKQHCSPENPPCSGGGGQADGFCGPPVWGDGSTCGVNSEGSPLSRRLGVQEPSRRSPTTHFGSPVLPAFTAAATGQFAGSSLTHGDYWLFSSIRWRGVCHQGRECTLIQREREVPVITLLFPHSRFLSSPSD